jgi:hypothetical protein
MFRHLVTSVPKEGASRDDLVLFRGSFGRDSRVQNEHVEDVDEKASELLYWQLDEVDLCVCMCMCVYVLSFSTGSWMRLTCVYVCVCVCMYYPPLLAAG